MREKLENLGWTPYAEALRWRRRCILAWVLLILVIVLWRLS